MFREFAVDTTIGLELVLENVRPCNFFYIESDESSLDKCASICLIEDFERKLPDQGKITDKCNTLAERLKAELK